MTGAVAIRESEALEEARTVLLLGPESDAAQDGCESLLGSVPPSARALHVAFGSTPDECAARWRGAPTPPAEIGIVDVGGGSRSAADGGAVSIEGVSIEPVAEPADLTGVNIALTGFLSRWEGSPIVACIDSLSTVLEDTSVERVFRFLNDATVRLKGAGADAHVHLDPTAHDEGTVNALAGLFEAVVEIDADGGRTIRTR